MKLIITKLNEFLSNRFYHISSREFNEFSLKFVLKGQSINKEGKGIYLSENKDFLLNTYKNKRKNYLYTVIINKTLVLIDWNENVSDIIYDRLAALEDNIIDAICSKANRPLTGRYLMHYLKQYDINIEKKLIICGIDGVKFLSEEGIQNYCIFDPKILQIINREEI
jgi:hypothetical protein